MVLIARPSSHAPPGGQPGGWTAGTARLRRFVAGACEVEGVRAHVRIVKGVSMNAELMHCPECGRLRLIETPPCADGHGSDCPDRACAVCGTALVLPSHVLTASRARAHTRHAA
ncbi:MAG TPA: hypothetical protein VGH01_12105 [Jatrophihabitantaceae bacterium]